MEEESRDLAALFQTVTTVPPPPTGSDVAGYESAATLSIWPAGGGGRRDAAAGGGGGGRGAGRLPAGRPPRPEPPAGPPHLLVRSKVARMSSQQGCHTLDFEWPSGIQEPSRKVRGWCREYSATYDLPLHPVTLSMVPPARA